VVPLTNAEGKEADEQVPRSASSRQLINKKGMVESPLATQAPWAHVVRQCKAVFVRSVFVEQMLQTVCELKPSKIGPAVMSTCRFYNFTMLHKNFEMGIYYDTLCILSVPVGTVLKLCIGAHMSPKDEMIELLNGIAEEDRVHSQCNISSL
jgi:hypothetical protein